MPLPLRKASIWEAGTASGGGIMTAFEKGYDAALVDKCLANALHEFANMVVDMSSVGFSNLLTFISRKSPSTSANKSNSARLFS